jgi:hypothetical protein
LAVEQRGTTVEEVALRRVLALGSLLGWMGCEPHRSQPSPSGAPAVASSTVGTVGTGGTGGDTGSGATAGTAGATGGAVEPSCAQPSCPEVLYGSRPGAPQRGIEVDDTDVFWCEITFEEGNVVRAAPKNGAGPVRTLGRWYDFLMTS